MWLTQHGHRFLKKVATIRGTACASLQSRIYVGSTVVVYGVILLALSQSHIRANWRVAGIRDEVARAIDDANKAVDEQRVEKALEICSLLDSKANADEKKKISDVRIRVEAIKQASRTTSANNTVIQLVEDGRRHIAKQKLDDAQSALKSALQVPMATDFSTTTELANEIVTKRNELAIDLLYKDELAKAKEQVQLAIGIPSNPDTSQTKRLLVDICNREVAQLVKSAREKLASDQRDEAEATLERALAIRDATETAEAEKILGGIREARAAEANARVSNLLADAERSINKELLDDAVRTLNTALAVKHSTRSEEVTATIRRVERAQTAERDRIARADAVIAAEAERERNARAVEATRERAAVMAAEAARKAEEEYDLNGLVLLRKTVKGTRGQFGGAITGQVVNRRNRKLSYVQITFLLYDESGAQVGNALANINGLEAGGTWKFNASTFGTDFSSYKFNELTGL